MHPVVAYLTCARESFALLLCFVFCVQASAQVAGPEGVQYRRDEKGRVVALDYWGTSGLVVPKDISQLEYVYIAYGTKLSADDMLSLSTLENVTDLTLGGVISSESVYIEGSLDELTKLKRLRRLSFCKHRLQDDDLAFVSKLPKLQHLELYADLEGDRGTLLTDRCAEFLSRAKTLQSIYIYSGEKLTDKFVDVITKDLAQLESLDFASDHLTDDSLALLADRCARLRQVGLRSKGFTDRGVRHLVAAKQLERVSLASSSLTDACTDSIKSLPRLKELVITIPTISDRALRQIVSAPNLEILALREPLLTDEQFALIEGHPRLQSAFLNGSNLTEGKVIEVIRRTPALKHLTVGPDQSKLQLAVNRALQGRREQP